jgi:hypothetical protein
VLRARGSSVRRRPVPGSQGALIYLRPLATLGSLTGRGSDLERPWSRTIRAAGGPVRATLSLLAALLGVALLAGVVVLVVDLAPAAKEGLEGEALAEEVSRARTAMVALLGILVASVGASFTARTYWLNRRGQITDRFTDAVEQLGHKSIDVRLGGIYALEQIALDSPKRDHRTTMEVLVAFVQVHAAKDSETRKPDTEDPRDPNRPRPDADVMGALMVLGRRKSQYDQGLRLNLPRTDLRGARLRYEDAQFTRAVLRYANLRGAHLEGAHLDEAELREVNLQGADLENAHLNGASLAKARLEGANLQGANLRGASLRKAELSPYTLPDGKLEPTILENADLSGAHLEGAKLSGATLQGANLHGAYADAGTDWPEGLTTIAERERRGVLGPKM